MNKKVVWTIGIIIVAIVAVLGAMSYWSWPNGNSVAQNSISTSTLPIIDTSNLIHVDIPLPDVLVQSPLIVKGSARGQWYFEASFPVKIFDSNGKLLGGVPAQAQGDWMTTDFVPFQATLTFDNPTTEKGTVVLQKDNPSGLPQNDASISIPVYFSANASKL